jgi:hypothetical protein
MENDNYGMCGLRECIAQNSTSLLGGCCWHCRRVMKGRRVLHSILWHRKV